MRARRPVFSLCAALALAGCELTDVAAPPAADVLVVEAVLRVGAEYQYVILHRSLEGRRIRGEPGASVVVTTAGAPDVVYQHADLADCLSKMPDEWGFEDLEVAASCYATPASAGRFVHPNRTYELLVETADGRRIRGRTTVPPLFELRSPALDFDPQTLSVTCRLRTDPFTLVWTKSSGAWAYISSLRLTSWGDDLREAGVEVPDPLDLTGVSVSATDTSQIFPGNLGLFQRFDLDQRLLIRLQEGLPPEADATLVVMAADRNYVNGVRGGRFNPSGEIRVSSVAGDGVGVFGSIVPLTVRSPGSGSGAGVPDCPATVAATK